MTVQIERLKLLYEAISGVPALIVTMHAWRTKIGTDGFLQHHDVTDEDLWNASKNLLCGTSAHPLAWAALHPALREQGWNTSVTMPEMYGKIQLAPGYKDQYGISAAAEFFGLEKRIVARFILPYPNEFYRKIEANEKQWFLDQVAMLLLGAKAITHSRYEHLIKEIYAS